MTTKKEINFAYTVQQAIEKGIFFDITPHVEKKNFCYWHVVVTKKLYEKCMLDNVEVKKKEKDTDSLRCNMIPLINSLRKACFLMHQDPKSHTIAYMPYERFEFCDFIRSTDRNSSKEKVKIKIIFGLEFEDKPVIAMLLPRETPLKTRK